jgi:hypothetical protein
LYYLTIGVSRWERILLRDFSRRIHQQFPGCHDAAADDDHFDVEEVDQISACDSQVTARFLENI